MLSPSARLILASSLLGIVFLVARWLHRVWFHPLARFPGPRWAAMSSAYAMSYDIPGKSYIKNFPAWHDLYGPIIRIEPNHLHIRDIDAYNDVYKLGTKFNKDPSLYSFPFIQGGLLSKLIAKEARGHRDLYAPHFSRGAVTELEPMIKGNISTFLSLVGQLADKHEPIDLTLAFKCLTAETIMSYALNSSIGAMTATGFGYEWVGPMEDFISDPSFAAGWYLYKPMHVVASWCKRHPTIGRRLNKAFAVALDQLGFCETRLHELSQAEEKEPVVFKTALDPNPKKGHPQLGFQVLAADAWTLYFAGTDTTAVTLATGVWHLLINPRYLVRLQSELKTAIPNSGVFDSLCAKWADLETLPFLSAVVKESLRLSYGVPGKNPRVVPSGGAYLCGEFIPGGTTISMSTYTLHHHPALSRTYDHTEFRPERWLTTDDAEVSEKYFVPFQRGSRSCLGQNLAVATLYLTFAYLFRNYDLVLFGTTAEDMEWQDALIKLTKGHLKAKARKVQG